MNQKEAKENIDRIVSELASLALKHPTLRSRLSQVSRVLRGSLDEDNDSLEDKSIYIPDPEFY